MSWPAQSDLINAVDLSFFNQVNQYTPPHIIPVPEFCSANPDIELFVLRACWPSGLPDPLYPIYFDALTAAGKKVAAYLWPNVTKTLATTKENWKRALGDRVPRLIALDFEEPSYGAPVDALSYNATASLDLLVTTFQRHPLGYGRANWMESHFKPGWQRNWRWWIAQYPLPITNPDGTWRQYGKHSELSAHLPIGNSFTPYLGRLGWFTQENTVAWQFSEYGFPAPTIWSRRMDLNSFKRSFVEPIYGGIPIPSLPIPPPVLTLEQRVDDHETRIAALEAE
jgi:hypothetical protein